METSTSSSSSSNNNNNTNNSNTNGSIKEQNNDKVYIGGHIGVMENQMVKKWKMKWKL